MGSKSSCFFILFVLVFVSSLSSSLAEEKCRVHDNPDMEDFRWVMFRLRDKDWMGVVLFNNSDYKHQGYEDLAVKYYNLQVYTVHFFRINTETFDDKDLLKRYNITEFPIFRFHMLNRGTFDPIRGVSWYPKGIEYMIKRCLDNHKVTVTAAAE